LTTSSDVDPHRLAAAYLDIKRIVIDAGFASEIDWQSSVHFEGITESAFLQEAAWVVLGSGMRQSIVQRLFPSITEAFLGWASARDIVMRREWCRRHALSVFNHKPKINAILSIADKLSALSLEWFLDRLVNRGVSYLERLPYIGPVTSFHLAKNLGVQVAKPDRHLVRIASLFGFESVQNMCETIAAQVCDPVTVVDIVLWRYATTHSDYRVRMRDAYMAQSAFNA